MAASAHCACDSAASNTDFSEDTHAQAAGTVLEGLPAPWLERIETEEVWLDWESPVGIESPSQLCSQHEIELPSQLCYYFPLPGSPLWASSVAPSQKFMPAEDGLPTITCSAAIAPPPVQQDCSTSLRGAEVVQQRFGSRPTPGSCMEPVHSELVKHVSPAEPPRPSRYAQENEEDDTQESSAAKGGEEALPAAAAPAPKRQGRRRRGGGMRGEARKGPAARAALGAEKSWEARRLEREAAIDTMKSNHELCEMRSIPRSVLGSRPHTPDPTNRGTSKREWERQVAAWREALRERAGVADLVAMGCDKEASLIAWSAAAGRMKTITDKFKQPGQKYLMHKELAISMLRGTTDANACP